MFKFEPSLFPGCVFPALFASLVLAGCAQTPVQAIETCVTPAVETLETRDPDDVKRIDELQRESLEFRIQAYELRRQMSERRRQFHEEKLRLEQELKEDRERADDLQKKLDAVLAVDRDLRRGGKISQ